MTPRARRGDGGLRPSIAQRAPGACRRVSPGGDLPLLGRAVHQVPRRRARRTARSAGVITSTVRARTAASGSVDDRPAGATSSQCRPVTTQARGFDDRRGSSQPRAASMLLRECAERERARPPGRRSRARRRARTAARSGMAASTSLHRAILMPHPRRSGAAERSDRNRLPAAAGDASTSRLERRNVEQDHEDRHDREGRARSAG